MANTREELVNRFVAFSGQGKVQSAIGAAQPNADIDTRDKCTITREEVITRRDIRDCRNQDLTDSQLITRAARYTLVYAEVTPQLYARWFAWFAGGSAAPTGTPANEVQRLTRSGTVSGGTFTLTLALEGRTATTKPIAWDATTAQIIAALTASRMRFIHPGDVTASGGTPEVVDLTVLGTCNSSGNLPVTVKAAGSVALAGAGKTINVAILNLDTASVVAGKIRAALAADTDVEGFMPITGATTHVIGTATTPAANDATMEISYPAVLGMTAAASAITTPGVAITLWGSTGMTLTFRNRLGDANLAQLVVDNTLITGGGTIVNTSVTNGDQNYHALTRATSRIKPRFSFALGYEDNTGTLEKYADYVCESFQPQGSLSADPSLTVTILGPWDYDSLEPGYTIPDCVNPDPLRTEDCKLEVNGVFQTSDLNSLTNNLNDNVPIDRLSAFPYDGIEVETLIRGKQPTYNSSASIFGIYDAAAFILAKNERSQDPVEIIQHFGLPGNRFTLIYPNAKIRFQNNRESNVGAAESAVFNLEFVPLVDGVDPPVNGEAYLDQTAQFLVASS